MAARGNPDYGHGAFGVAFLAAAAFALAVLQSASAADATSAPATEASPATTTAPHLLRRVRPRRPSRNPRLPRPRRHRHRRAPHRAELDAVYGLVRGRDAGRRRPCSRPRRRSWRRRRRERRSPSRRHRRPRRRMPSSSKKRRHRPPHPLPLRRPPRSCPPPPPAAAPPSGAPKDAVIMLVQTRRPPPLRSRDDGPRTPKPRRPKPRKPKQTTPLRRSSASGPAPAPAAIELLPEADVEMESRLRRQSASSYLYVARSFGRGRASARWRGPARRPVQAGLRGRQPQHHAHLPPQPAGGAGGDCQRRAATRDRPQGGGTAATEVEGRGGTSRRRVRPIVPFGHSGQGMTNDGFSGSAGSASTSRLFAITVAMSLRVPWPSRFSTAPAEHASARRDPRSSQRSTRIAPTHDSQCADRGKSPGRPGVVCKGTCPGMNAWRIDGARIRQTTKEGGSARPAPPVPHGTGGAPRSFRHRPRRCGDDGGDS